MTTARDEHSVRSRRAPLRLRLVEHPGSGRVDGGWWPQSRDLEVELGELVEDFPPSVGRVVRVLYSPPDWNPSPRRFEVGDGFVKVGPFPGDDPHLMHLTTSDRRVLRLVVVPPGLSPDQGAEALLAACRPEPPALRTGG